jgi:DNA-binding IclR family transcriptional regulator
MANLKTQSVPSVERALAILEMLAESGKGLTLSQLVQRLGLPKSSTHCLLLTLERRGYLYHGDHTGRYMFGLKLFSLANMALVGIKLREQARPFLTALMERTRLTVHMAILERNEAVLVEKVEPPGILKLATWIGKRMDAHCTSLGKALIAHLPTPELDRLIREHGLPRHNEKTIASSRRLKEDLAQVRKLGYAVDNEEDEIGLRCVGCPIFDHAGGVIAAISVSGTLSQIAPEGTTLIAQDVRRTALAISRELGFREERAGA